MELCEQGQCLKVTVTAFYVSVDQAINLVDAI